MNIKTYGKGTFGSPFVFIDTEDEFYIKGQHYLNRIKRVYEQKYGKDDNWSLSYQASLSYLRGLGSVSKRKQGFIKTCEGWLPDEMLESMKIKDDNIFIQKVTEFEEQQSEEG